MMSYFLTALYCISTICCLICGRGSLAGQAVLDGAQAAVSFSLSLTGGICLWSGLSEVMARSGAANRLSKLLRPVLSRLFPLCSRDAGILSALSENVSANILGLGNAATPAGIRAAKGMAAKNAKNELCLLVVLNSASIQLIPSTIAAVRQAAGASSAFDIMPAVWFSSAVSLSVGLSAAAIFRRLWK